MSNEGSRGQGRFWRGAGAVAVLLVGAAALAGGTSESVHTRSAQVVPVGTPYRGECVLEGQRIDGRIASWEIASVIPAFRRGGNGVVLSPPADQLPRLANGPEGPPFGDTYVLVPAMMASPLDDDCAVRTFDPLGAVTLEQPGPHVFVQYERRVTFVRVPSDQAPEPQPCTANDPEFPQHSSDIPAPDEIPGDEKIWAVSNFCNVTHIVGLAVKTTMRCSSRGDMSRWPSSPYINQFDAGARLRLPVQNGYRGGNASGPSALLMAMLRSAGPRNLPSLKKVYYATMQRRSNAFVPAKAVAYLRSRGWHSARRQALGTNVQQMERRILTSLSSGPIVISTSFGNGEWGQTSGGHLLVIVGADRRGNFVVQDPAGNYFSSPQGGHFPRGHYGPRACGHRTLYPHYWLLAYTTGRYLIELGPRAP